MKQLTDGSMLKDCQKAQRDAELVGFYDPIWRTEVAAHGSCPYTEAACWPFDDGSLASESTHNRLRLLDLSYISAVLDNNVLRGAEFLSLIEAYLVEWRYRPGAAR